MPAADELHVVAVEVDGVTEKAGSVDPQREQEAKSDGEADAPTTPVTKSLRFWLVFLAICLAQFLSALEFSAVSTVLPTIAHELNSGDFVWVASAYGLASTALLPASGAIAETFGRKSSALVWLALFALGSALCGSARNMNWLIAARTVQGAGGGGIVSSTSILISDLVPLKDRALYNSLNGFTWGVAATLGPIIGGAFASKPGLWRWLFYINIPLTGLSAALVVLFLRVKTPRGSLREKLGRMDWIGNLLIIGGTSAVIIALSWADVRFPWSSAQVLAPLITGVGSIVLFFVYEATLAKEPLVPFLLISNRTTVSGYIQSFISPLVTVTSLYFLPTFFQACWGASPGRSGIDLLGLNAVVGPTMLLNGAFIAITKRYREVLWAGWAFYIASVGGLSTLTVGSSIAATTGFSVMLSIGSGLLYPATYFPVLAPLPVEENARALALMFFCRSLAGVWGVTIGTAVLQTQLAQRLPPAFSAQFPQGAAVAYSAIPAIASLEEPLRTEARVAFAGSLRVLWQVLTGISGIGVLASLMMKGLSLHGEVDKKWAMDEDADRSSAPTESNLEAPSLPKE
ncbi:MFS general substrate transporter [Phanerochaete sordida]|uniref:MFS general substrate transporter n=1 Tax=Phanerochaete sordida TaxID=48140 RepID=A0A9P3GP58_9APHY|nr:MFS general substrate transporter [Phanerochaete sordida]